MKSPHIPQLLLGTFLTFVPVMGVEVNTSFNPNLPPGTVHSIALASDGSVFVAGEFSGASVLKVTSSEAVRVLPTEEGAYSVTAAGGKLCAGGSFGVSTSDWNVQANGRVLAVVPAGEKLFVGGTFWSQPGCFVARLNSDGSIDSTFKCGLKMNFSIEAGVSAFALQPDGKVIAGGNFNTDAGFSSLARLNPDGSVDATFSRNNGATLYPKTITVLADGKILVGGMADSSGRGFVRRLNSDGTVDTSFSEATFNNSVQALAIDSAGRLIVGGTFTAANGGAYERLLRLNADGSIDPNWTVGANNAVKAIIASGGSIYVGGAFTEIGGAVQNGIAQIDQLSALGTPAALKLSLKTQGGHGYVIESSSDLKSWSEVRRESGGEHGVTVNASPTEPRLFFRARLVD